MDRAHKNKGIKLMDNGRCAADLAFPLLMEEEFLGGLLGCPLSDTERVEF